MCVWWQWLANTDYWQVWWPWQTSGNATTSLPWEPHGKLVVAHGWSQPVATGRYWLEHGHSQWQYTDSVCVCVCIHNNTATDTAAAACLVFVKSISDWYQQCLEKWWWLWSFLVTDDFHPNIYTIYYTLYSSGFTSNKNDINVFSSNTHQVITATKSRGRFLGVEIVGQSTTEMISMF